MRHRHSLRFGQPFTLVGVRKLGVDCYFGLRHGVGFLHGLPAWVPSYSIWPARRSQVRRHALSEWLYSDVPLANKFAGGTMHKLSMTSLMICIGVVIGAQAWAQQPPAAGPAPVPYGTPITLDQAKKVADAAEAEAKKNNWNMTIAIAEPSGSLVYLRKMDGAPYASLNVAPDKARSAATFRNPTKAFEDRLAADPSWCGAGRAWASDRGERPDDWRDRHQWGLGTGGWGSGQGRRSGAQLVESSRAPITIKGASTAIRRGGSGRS
jgi:Haem-degrading